MFLLKSLTDLEAKEIETWETSNLSNAYMLVYIRVDRIKELLKPLSEKDVPQRLVEEIESTKKLEEEKVYQIK